MRLRRRRNQAPGLACLLVEDTGDGQHVHGRFVTAEDAHRAADHLSDEKGIPRAWLRVMPAGQHAGSTAA